MNILSLFDGMSCGQIAIERADIKIDNYYASEIDKYAIKVTQANYPNTVQLGDIEDWHSWDIEQPDLIMGGSPCQGFSFAGKQLNFNDPRSKLFFTFVDILKHYKPKYFLLENVKMKKEFQDVISNLLGVEPIEINSALVSAQNRKRLYWTNIPNVEQPNDKGILLKDIIEDGGVLKEKSQTILSTLYKENAKSMVTRNKQGLLVLCGAWRGRYTVDGKRQDHKMKTAGLTTQRLEVRSDEKTNSLTTVQKDNNVVSNKKCLLYLGSLEKGRRLYDGKNLSRNFGEGYRIYSINGKSATLTAQSKGGSGGYSGLYGNLKDNQIYYRKLTPLECERLQTVPDNYTNHVSNTQRYKMLGNGWTVDVIAHIFSNIK